MSSLKDRAIDILLVCGMVICVGLLIGTLQMMFVHIVCGVLFMSVAAYTLLMGQEAASLRARLGWFVCTGAVLFLFTYWAMQVVFRAPKVPTTMGCGGVKFVNGPLGAGGVEGEGPGELRTEL